MDGASDKITVGGGSDHANDRNDDNLLTHGREVDSQNDNGDGMTNNEMTIAEHPVDTNNDDNNNNVDFEEEEPDTQESFTQHEMTQTGNELTQMGLFDDDDDDDDGNNCNNDEDGENSQQEPMIDPLTLPWARLMPVGSNNGSGDNISMTNYSSTAGTNATTTTAASSATTTSLQRPSTREPIEMLPRPPESRTITRSRSPSLDNGRLSNENKDCNSSSGGNNSQNNEDYGLTFMGLKNLVPSDRFNEYVLGRSVKVSEVRLL